MTEASSKTPMASVLKRTDEASPDGLVPAWREDICDLQLAAPASPRWPVVAMIAVGIISLIWLFQRLDHQSALAVGAARPVHWDASTVLLLVLALASFLALYFGIAHKRSAERRVLLMRLSRELQERRESEGSYRLLVQNAPDAIVTVNPAGRLTSVNPFVETVTGRSSSELLQKPVMMLLHPDDALAAAEVFQSAVSGKKPPAIEIRIVKKSGEAIPMEFIVTPQVREKGVCGVLAIGRDVSARRAAEQMQAQLETQLRRTQKMEALGRLAGGVAHDFNNFLTVILANSQLTGEMLPKGHPAIANVESINSASLRATELVRQILTFSRHQPPERKATQLDSVVMENLKLLRSVLPSSITIQARLMPDCPSVLGNEEQLHQVLFNLGTNAAHAMREKGGKLEISLTALQVDEEFAARNPDLHAGLYARLTVSDNGHGMDSATLEHIFDPFFTTKPTGEGTGLGLAVVHGIVKGHEGAITVSSEPGRRTSFDLYFPAFCHQNCKPISFSTRSPRKEQPTAAEVIHLVVPAKPV